MRILVFSGTGDGRELCEKLVCDGHSVTASVATEYGAALMRGMMVIQGRLDPEQMAELMPMYDAVVDATHPYAKEVTQNIIAACRRTGKRYIRLIRDKSNAENTNCFGDIKSAVAYLQKQPGRIFVSVGSKELGAFLPVAERVKARVLDTEPVRAICHSFEGMEIVYKIPPYTIEENLKDFEGCRYLVTKDSGSRGGVEEKLRAAKQLGMEVLMISRPIEEKGCTMDEIRSMLCI